MSLPSPSTRQQYGLVLLCGFFGGGLFLFPSMTPSEEKQILSTLAAVQGSFLAIFVSVFLLSLQVTASEFSPLAIDSLKDEKTINGIIVIFVFSIFLDLYYISSDFNPIWNPNTHLNIEASIGVALGIVCLLSLIPIKAVMSDLVSSDTILKRAEKNISADDLSEGNQLNLDSPPERTKLLMIEQIFRSANQRQDHYTERHAIFSLNRSICKIISELDSHKNIDSHALFGHWDRCQDTVSSNGYSRIRLINSGNKKIVTALLENDINNEVDERLSEWRCSINKVFNSGVFESELVSGFYSVGVKSNKSGCLDISEKAIAQLSQLSNSVFTIANADEEVTISGERRDVLIKIIESTIKITSSELPDNTSDFRTNKRRSLAKKAKTTVDEIMEKTINPSEEVQIPEAALQNIGNSAAEQFLTSAILLSKFDMVISTNYLLCFGELASQTGTPLNSSFSSVNKEPDPEFVQIIDNAVDELDSNYLPSIESLSSVEVQEIKDSLEDLRREIED